MRTVPVLALCMGGVFTLSEPIGAEQLKDSVSVAGNIEVTIEGIRTKEKGVLLVSLFRGKDGWLETDSAVAVRTLPVRHDTIMVSFEQVPYDSSYAIQVIHDKNQNGKFDMRWFPYPKPKEGAGVSNNNLRRGPPEYEKARFALTEPTRTLRIRLQY